MNLPRRSILLVSVALASGAGGAAVATLADGSSTETRTVTATSDSAQRAAIRSGDGLTANEIYRRAKAGVVDITVTSRSSGAQGGPFGAPEGSGRTQQAEGSGFVIDKQGHIATNQHVVDGASSIRVTFADGTKASAELVGEDPSTDVAVIKVDTDASKLTPLSFADSSKVQVGSGVVAIGSPFGLEGSLTTGVVSALDRTMKAPNGFTISGAIQTDAAINHGNSGGPLLDADGRVVGINSQIKSDSGGNDGVGFAIPSNTVKEIAASIVDDGDVEHAYLGVQLADASGGAEVGAVTAGSPAAKAGLRQGDVVTAIDGRGVSSSDALVAAVDAHAPGDEITLKVRRDDATRDLKLKLGTRPSAS